MRTPRSIVNEIVADSLRKLVANNQRIEQLGGKMTAKFLSKFKDECEKLAKELTTKENAVEPEAGQPVVEEGKDNLPEDRDAAAEGGEAAAAS